MRVIFGALKEFNNDAMLMAKQLGANGIHFNTPPIPGEKTWDKTALKWLIDYAKGFDLKLEAIENVPIRFYDKVMLGQKGKDEQIENYCNIIKNMGELNIPLLGHHFCPNWAWRTSLIAKGRGNANVSEYVKANEKNGNAYVYPYITDQEFPTREELWKNYEYFLKAVIPVAEKYGVKLMAHPSDPPLPEVDGKARILISHEDFISADAITGNSNAYNINLCLGCFSQLGGEKEVLNAIEYWGSRKKIGLVHFRDVQGNGENFKECFLGEGNFDPAKVLIALKKVDYQGCIMDDHVPYTVNATRWGHLGRAHEGGYVQGMIKMLDYLISIGEIRL